MLTDHSPDRHLRTENLTADFVIVGGGAAGTCCAITAARAGLKVVLMQDRPVLGGNASSEVRLWLLGATAHMGSSNRWAREGGVINEVFMENLWRNSEGNPVIFDTVLLDLVVAEKNITLLLNTTCFEVTKDPGNASRISGVKGICAQNSTMYEVSAPLFCDASGDGVVGFLSGAAFRMGAEGKEEFKEGFAPSGEFGQLLGHSIYFYSKDVGHPVTFVPPNYALLDVEGKIPRYRDFNTKTQGSKLWWIEWGGRLDTVHDTEQIKWELWRVVYGVWNYIKNSGKFPDAENLTLEWVGTIPGKRESRRFEGDYMLRQQDIVERRQHADGVAFGGWSIDLHPADGVFAEMAGSHHLHSKGVYQIPYRCYYSRNIENLFLAGRIISASHVAFGSTRVMATCALGGQAVAHAAALCRQYGELPRDILKPDRMKLLHRELGRAGNHVPGVNEPDPENFAVASKVSVSSALEISSLPDGGPLLRLERNIAQMVPLSAGAIPSFSFLADVDEETELAVEFRTTSDPWHQSPDVVLASSTIRLGKGTNQKIQPNISTSMEREGYLFLCFIKNPAVLLHTSPIRATGVLRLHWNWAENCLAVGGEKYDVYAPERRPGGHNVAFEVSSPVRAFGVENLSNGWQRPVSHPNAWVAALEDVMPEVTLAWDNARKIQMVQIHFDGDFDHSMETVLWGHPERAVVFCVKKYEVLDDRGNVLVSVDDNHHSLVRHAFGSAVETSAITLRILETWGAPAAVFEIRCY